MVRARYLRIMLVSALLLTGCTGAEERGERVAFGPRGPDVPTQGPVYGGRCEGTTSAAELRDALAGASAGDVIEIPNCAVIDLMDVVESLPLEIKESVTLQSTRGAMQPGALLTVDDYERTVEAFDGHTATIFSLGDNAQIRNLRLRGPYGGSESRKPRILAIQVDSEDSALISGNEIFNWPGAAIDVTGQSDTRECQDTRSRHYKVKIRSNYLHHNQISGFGYGVRFHRGARGEVWGNTFDWNRHAIADDGTALSGYIAGYNYVLHGGSTYPGFLGFPHYDQHFDVHGQYDGYGGTAGDLVWIIGNTVHGEQGYGLGKTRPVYYLRGHPCNPSLFRHNVVVHDDAGEAIKTKDGGDGQVVGADDNQYDTDTSWDLGIGDFDGDSRDDLFQATGVAWYYSSGGVTEWRLLQAARTETIDQLRFGDFDGDGDTDVFTAVDGEWRISRGGTEPWEHLAWSAVPLERLRFADFDGDSRTDAFKANGSTWTYSPGESSAWVEPPLAHSAYTVDELRFGNFDDDARTDVFGIEGGAWSVSYGGTQGWRPLNSILTKDLDSLVFADFDGNGRTDIAQSRYLFDISTVEWRVSWDGTSDWMPLRTVPGYGSHDQLYNHWIGNFDSGPGVDALRYEPAGSRYFPLEGVYIVRSSGARGVYVRHSWNAMR